MNRSRTVPRAVPLCAVAAAMFAAACAPSYDIAYPEPRPLTAPLPSPISAHSEFAEPPADSLRLADALALAFRHNPSLRGAAFEVRALEGEAYQAARPLNPEVEAEVEELGGTGERVGIGGAEGRAALAQTIELGGDRRARADVAARGAELGAWDLEAARLDLATEVKQAFVALLVAERRQGLAQEQADIARRFADAVTRAAEAGAVSPLEGRRASVAAVTAETALGRARRTSEAARARLAATFGGRASTLSVRGDLDALMPVPPMDALVPLVEQSPEVARYGAVLGQGRAQIALERARRVPDPTVRAGVAYFNENGDMGALLGVSIPIPLFDTNRGAIEAASARGEAARAEAEGAYLDAVRSLAVSYGTLTASAEAARALRTQALPDARIAYEGILTGYREGEFDLLAALDAQRALVETQNALLDALADYWQARAEVERLVAAPLDDLR